MRLPNGYGSVTKLSGKRRNPWMVRITTDFTDEGVQIRKNLGYFPTRAAAIQALSEYHNNPYDIDSAKLTLAEIYEKWFEKVADTISRSLLRQMKASYKQMLQLHNLPIKNIRLHQMQAIIDNCKNGYQSQRKIKQLFSKLYEFCIDYEILQSNPTGRLKIAAKSDETARPRERISDDEINRLWAIFGDVSAQIALMLIYSGVRVGELLNLKKEDINLEQRFFKVRASKTSSGIRVVPIAEKVFPFWQHFYETSPCDYVLYNKLGRHLNYETFSKRYWKPLMEQIKADHVIHETRHTCITLLTLAEVNPTIIKNIVGHKAAMSLTERVYTHIDVQPLIDAINKI